MPAGYSGTPLDRKLGIKPGFRVAFLDAPADFRETLGPLPDRVEAFEGLPEKGSPRLDLVVMFTTSRAKLAGLFPRSAKSLNPAGMLWVAWPKKASGVPTEVNESEVREFGLSQGLVDTKICAIDATWSGLKFVRRLADR